MKLSDYLKHKNISINDFAKTIGVAYITIRRIVDEEYEPRLKTALKIERATDGKVNILDLTKWK